MPAPLRLFGSKKAAPRLMVRQTRGGLSAYQMWVFTLRFS